MVTVSRGVPRVKVGEIADKIYEVADEGSDLIACVGSAYVALRFREGSSRKTLDLWTSQQ